MSFCNTTINGHLGRDPELKTTSKGMNIVSFSVAVNLGYGANKTTHWFNCKAFKKTADIVLEHCRKGKEVIVNGEMRSSKWEDKQGNKRTSWELIANQVVFKGSKEEAPKIAAEADDSEIPF